MATVRKEMYVKSDVNNNNNKFWEAQIEDSGVVTCRWGRVGDDGQSKTFSFGSVNEANHFVDGKIKEKTRDGRNGEIAYRKIDVVGSSGTVSNSSTKTVGNSDLQRIATSQIKTNNPVVEELIRYLTKVNIHNITEACSGKISYSDTTGLFTTPLGVVTQANIDEANDLLVKIGDLVATKDYNNKDMIPLTNSFLMLIPQNFGRARLDVREFWSDLSRVQYQKQILDSLQASYASVISGSAPKMDAKIIPDNKVFDCQLFLIEDGKIIDHYFKMYNDTKLRMHTCYHLRPIKMWGVNIKQEKEDFEKYGKKLGNIFELFHGSVCSNLISIFRKGLIIPPASSSHCTGRLFGNGIYASKTSTKAAGYSYGYWGGKTQDRFFVFILDMAMGKYCNPNSSSTRFPVLGYDSTYVLPNTCGVKNDELIVYRTNQVSLKYLIELK